MSNIRRYFDIKQMIKDKREFKRQMERIDALPEDYGYVYKKIQKYMWGLCGGDGYDMLEIQYELIDLFEEGAANGKAVLEVTGRDVAAFADELLENAGTYISNRRIELNKDIAKRVGR